MIPEEARWLRRILEVRQPSTILDCGSSSAFYRSSTQPYISSLFDGFHVTHLDAQAAPGVDLVVDLCDAEPLPQFPLVVCASLLEHVATVDAALNSVCQATGHDLLLTVPRRWPSHGGFDNGFRPSLGQLCEAVERRGLLIRQAELLDACGPYEGRRINVLHAEREDAA